MQNIRTSLGRLRTLMTHSSSYFHRTAAFERNPEVLAAQSVPRTRTLRAQKSPPKPIPARTYRLDVPVVMVVSENRAEHAMESPLWVVALPCNNIGYLGIVSSTLPHVLSGGRETQRDEKTESVPFPSPVVVGSGRGSQYE